MKVLTYSGKSIHIRLNRDTDLLFKGEGIPKHYHISEITPELIGSVEAYEEVMREVDNAQHSIHTAQIR